MAAMTESVNAKVLGVLVLITVLLVVNVTIGLQAFYMSAVASHDQAKRYDAVLPIQQQQVAEQEQLASLGYDVAREAYRIPIEQAMQRVVEQGGSRP